MPRSSVVKDKAVYVGAVVGIKWKPGEVYDAEILKISSKTIYSYYSYSVAHAIKISMTLFRKPKRVEQNLQFHYQL